MTQPLFFKPTQPGSLGWRLVPIWLAASLGLGLAGPFGTYTMLPLFARIAHFLACSLLIGGGMAVLLHVVRRGCRQPLSLPLCLAIVAAMALPGALIVQASLSVLAPTVAARVGLFELASQVFLVNCAVVGAILFWRRRRLGKAEPVIVLAPALASVRALLPLDAALPFALRGAPITALSAEDHYVKVHTERGDALVLKTMGEAVAALDGLPGIRVHRSHWVASGAIRGVVRSGGQVKVSLSCGRTVPASRSGRKELVSQGLI